MHILFNIAGWSILVVRTNQTAVRNSKWPGTLIENSESYDIVCWRSHFAQCSKEAGLNLPESTTLIAPFPLAVLWKLSITPMRFWVCPYDFGELEAIFIAWRTGICIWCFRVRPHWLGLLTRSDGPSKGTGFKYYNIVKKSSKKPTRIANNKSQDEVDWPTVVVGHYLITGQYIL